MKNKKTLSLSALVATLLIYLAAAGCSPAIEPDEPIRTSNPVDELHSELSAKKAAEESRFDWYDYSDALILARRENKYVMLVFYTDWCKWCKKFKEETLKDPSVSMYLKNNFVSAKIDAESSSKVIYEMRKITMLELAEEYEVTNYPTIWFLEPDGTRAKPLNGYLSPEDFLIYLKYINTGSYKAGG